MVIQALCRDYNLRIANERGILQPVYLLSIKKISDNWLKRYFTYKANALKEALKEKRMPAICKPRERWNDQKCAGYCPVAAQCPHGHFLKQAEEGAIG